MKFRFFLLMLLSICMVGCNDEMDSLVTSVPLKRDDY